MYHSIGLPQKNERMRSLYVTPGMFRFQMWYLQKAGYKVVPLQDMLAVVEGSDTGERLVALTFDDGFQNFYDYAYPVLRAREYPSTVFPVSDLVGKENRWDHDSLIADKKLMDWDTILNIKDRGVSFGAHSRTHPFLTRLTSDDLKDEIEGSKAALEERLGTPVDFFCYPYGDYDEKVVTAVRKAGYRGAVTTNRGLVHKGDDPFAMSRSFIRLNTHPLLFMIKLHTMYEDKKGSRK
jgi:peptidoglycan/xylan/chitin deacetylase (PgdA/CDA1 family)